MAVSPHVHTQASGAALGAVPGGLQRRLDDRLIPTGSKDRKLVVPKATHRKRAHAHPDHVTPTASPVKWAELLKRVWGIDALKCPKCDRRMTALAVVEDAAEVARYLAHTGQTTVYQRAQTPPDLAA